MTDERDKSSRTGESQVRPTARDVPFMRGVESVSEPAPHGQRPGQLPRDPSYDAELAQVDLAVLRDRTDPSTKQVGRRSHEPQQAPESVTPESPGTRASQALALGQSPLPPSSGGRAVASGTLLSVGAVDPRGRTERTLETPRMFFSQTDAAGEVYFKPGSIPAVTVHQTLETETVKLSDSIDPRRARTIPRLDRVALAQLAAEGQPESAAPMVLSGPASSLPVPASDASARWHQIEPDPASLPSNYDAGIHASLSPFRERLEPSFSLDAAPTRPEPIAGRYASAAPESPPPTMPDASTIPTQRDLPAHRIEASQPPPAPSQAVAAPDSARASELPRPMTASITAEEPERRPAWVNYAAFMGALLLAVVIGLFLTRKPAPDTAPPSQQVQARPSQPAAVTKAAPQPVEVAPPMPEAPAATPRPPASPPAAEAAPKKAPLAPVAPAPSPKSAPPKSNRETIF